MSDEHEDLRIREVRIKPFSNVNGLFMLAPETKDFKGSQELQFSSFYPCGTIKEVDALTRLAFYERVRELEFNHEFVKPNALMHLVSSSDDQQHAFIGLEIELDRNPRAIPEVTIHPSSSKRFRLDYGDGDPEFLFPEQISLASQIVLVRGERDGFMKKRVLDRMNAGYTPRFGKKAYMMVGGHPEGNFNHAVIPGYVA